MVQKSIPRVLGLDAEFSGLLGERQGQLRALLGLVHPHTQNVLSYGVLLENRRKYLDLISKASDDPSCGLVFVGTAQKPTLKKLMSLDDTLKKSLSCELPETDEAGRARIAQMLGKAGVSIPYGGLYGYLDELSLLLIAMSSIDKSRFFYFESAAEPEDIRRKLSSRTKQGKLDVLFTGEKPEVCVKDRLMAFVEVLKPKTAQII
jgi:hypothetical protein